METMLWEVAIAIFLWKTGYIADKASFKCSQALTIKSVTIQDPPPRITVSRVYRNTKLHLLPLMTIDGACAPMQPITQGRMVWVVLMDGVEPSFSAATTSDLGTRAQFACDDGRVGAATSAILLSRSGPAYKTDRLIPDPGHNTELWTSLPAFLYDITSSTVADPGRHREAAGSATRWASGARDAGCPRTREAMVGATVWLAFTIHHVSAHTTNGAMSRCGQPVRHVGAWLEEYMKVPGCGGPWVLWTTPWNACPASCDVDEEPEECRTVMVNDIKRHHHRYPVRCAPQAQQEKRTTRRASIGPPYVFLQPTYAFLSAYPYT
ncbi:hypothetical protein LA080_012411 [Diaporthe eres]|nr:hypothetical protein LA080_012411 [Diaporthe eres]